MVHQADEASPGARERILDAALRLVDELGVDAVTHRAVAARAGVSPGSTTHHFRSREHLLREAFLHYLRHGEGVIGALLAQLADRDVAPLDRVEALLCGVVEREFAEGFVRAEYELLLWACTDAELAAEVSTWEARVVGAVAEVLEAGGVDRPITAARALVNLVRGYELERLLDPALTVEDFRARLRPVLEGFFGT